MNITHHMPVRELLKWQLEVSSAGKQCIDLVKRTIHTLTFYKIMKQCFSVLDDIMLSMPNVLNIFISLPAWSNTILIKYIRNIILHLSHLNLTLALFPHFNPLLYLEIFAQFITYLTKDQPLYTCIHCMSCNTRLIMWGRRELNEVLYGYPQSLHQIPEYFFILCHDCFLLHPSKFINQLTI
jgi:hypothetical protein